MTDLTHILASYVPLLVVHHFLNDPSPPSEPVEDRFPAALLFADFSGFTALAEHLAQQGPSGAEELSSFLNGKFDQLITLITVLGGDVVSFAGDALLALWTAKDGDLPTMTRRAAQCSLALQEIFTNERDSPSAHLGMRIVIGVGDVGIFHIGGVFGRWLWLVTGSPVVNLMHIEQLSQSGQVVLSCEAWDLVQEYCYGQPIFAQTNGHIKQGVCLKTVLEPAPIYFPPQLRLASQMDSALRSYIPDVVLTRLAAGQGNWLAELRTITVLFINVPELHDSNTTLEQMQTCMCLLQNALYRYEGSVNKLSVDEKGTMLIAVFGLPPLAHEDDTIRGIQAALALQADLQISGFRCSIGVTTGRAFCGILGNTQRREYTILGDIVNLAARLMQVANDDILCDHATYHATQTRFLFDMLDPITVKGKADPIAIYRPCGQTQRIVYPQSALIGRTEESSIIASHLQLLQRGKVGRTHQSEATVLVIEGEAGMGKSRLIHNLRRNAEAMNITTLCAASDAVEQLTPYYPWRRIFAQTLDIEKINDPEVRRQHILNQLAAEPEMLYQASLLNAVLPLDLPGDSSTARLSGQTLADTTRVFLLDLLQLTIARSPALLIFEDVHWLDSASWLLLLTVAQNIPSLLIIVTTRPVPESIADYFLRLTQLSSTHHLTLKPMSLEDTYALMCQRLGVSRAPESVASLIHQKSQGNPFFIEELSYALRDTGNIVIHDGVCWVAPETGDIQTLSLPATAQGLITSRIDRLSAAQQLTLKVASVIGYTFSSRILHDIYPVEDERQIVFHHLAMLESLGFLDSHHQEYTWESDTAMEKYYSFKNVMIQEVVYHLMPFAQRRQLHRAVAEWYLQTYATHLEEYAPLLAQHFAQADDPRAIEYYTLAGNEAYRIYANTEAVKHFRRALDMAYRHQAESHQFIFLYTQCGRILEVMAEYEQALALYEQMDELANERGDRDIKLSALMTLAMLRSTPNPLFDPQKGEVLLEQALRLARNMKNRIAETRVLWNLMLLKIHTGTDSLLAVSYGEQSLALARDMNLREQMAFTLNDLSMAYRLSGQIERSQEVLEQACAIWRELSNLPMLSDNLSRYSLGHFFLGNYHQSVATSDEAHAISESIGNIAGQANSRLLVGHVYLEQGRISKAIQVMSDAIFLAEQVGLLTVQIGTRADLGWVYGTMGQIEHGIVLAEVALARSEEHKGILQPWALAILARLLILKGDLTEATHVVQESYRSMVEKGELLLSPIYVRLAHAELAMMNHEYERVIQVTDDLLNYLRHQHIRPFVPDALSLQSQALFAKGQMDKAYVLLQQALEEAKTLESERMLWQILFSLSHIEARFHRFNEAAKLRKQARDIVQYIANQAKSAELHESFLAQPHVRMVWQCSTNVTNIAFQRESDSA